MSAAFDTIDHLILLQRLRRHFGISGTALRWFKSCVSDRYQSINISGTLSCPQHLPFGVSQGFVIGPVLFSLYTTSLSQVITNHNLSHHLYADDTQVYISLSQPNAQESVSTLSDCLTDILFWMESSKLKLNPDTFASIFLKYRNPVSLIYVISVQFGVTYLYLPLTQIQRH